MSWLGQLYNWIWFHSEFWITPINRRPWTFCIRDWIFTHPLLAVDLIGIWYILIVILHFGHAPSALILGIISSFVLAHLVWGSKWIEGQQEFPTYLGEED